MPYIELRDWNTKNEDEKWIDVFRVFSVVFFPNEKDQKKERDDFVACFVAEKSQNSPRLRDFLDKTYVSDHHTLMDNLIQTLLNAPAFSELKEKASKNSFNANIAGEILFGNYQFNQSLPAELIGIKKSSYLLSKYGDYKTQEKMQGGVKIKVPKKSVRRLSKSTIENYWEQYQEVAHFYAALRLHPGESRIRKFNFNFLKPAKFLDFLAISKIFGDFAQSFIPKHGQRKPLVSGKKIWTVKISSPLPGINLQFPPPPNWVKKALQDYKAPRSNP